MADSIPKPFQIESYESTTVNIYRQFLTAGVPYDVVYKMAQKQLAEVYLLHDDAEDKQNELKALASFLMELKMDYV